MNAPKRAVVAIDSHAHVLDPARFAYSPQARYQPAGQEIGTLERYLAVLDAHRISHSLLVQPTSGYLNDHRCLLDAVDRAGGRVRAIVRLDPGGAGDGAALLGHPAVAGMRLDLIDAGTAALAQQDTHRQLGALAEHGLVLQVQCELDQLADALPELRRFHGRIVVDHCGRPDPLAGLAQRGFDALLELGRDGHYVKLSGPFRFSRQPYPFPDCDPFAHALIEAFTPQRCVWGSDWPFLRLDARFDYGPSLALLERWLPDAAARAMVLGAVPAALFGFA
ncbi:MAG: amidohydrolase family protein [Burkholderiaceae bacterium]|nr:amidohydrolase family protein [Burkholderiaceae bacterium]